MKGFNCYSILGIHVLDATSGIYTKVNEWELRSYLYEKMNEVIYNSELSEEQRNAMVNRILDAYNILSNEEKKYEYDFNLELRYLRVKEYIETFVEFNKVINTKIRKKELNMFEECFLDEFFEHVKNKKKIESELRHNIDINNLAKEYFLNGNNIQKNLIK